MVQKLQIYIADDCPTCLDTKNLVDNITSRYPNIDIELINLSDLSTIQPEIVFAIPTFVFNERIIFLGNPSLTELDEYFSIVNELRSNGDDGRL